MGIASAWSDASALSDGARASSVKVRAASMTPTRRVRLAVGFVVAVFLASRFAALAMGLPYNTTVLQESWNMIDPALLATDLWRSLLYLHAEPPIFNLIAALALKLSPDQPEWVLAPLTLTAGLLTQVVLIMLMIRLGVALPIALALSFLFLMSPATLLFDTQYGQSPLLTMFLVGMALFLHNWATKGRSRDAVAALLCGAGAVWLKPFYQLVWLAPVALAMLCLHRGWRRPALAVAAAAVLLLAAAPTVKNWVIYGWPSSSTWVGMNLARLALSPFTQPDLAKLRAQGVVSEIALIRSFSPLSDYAAVSPASIQWPTPTGIPLLDQEIKSNGEPNRHNAAYIALSRAYLRDSIAASLANPAGYAKGVAGAAFYYFMPAEDWNQFDGRRPWLGALDRVYAHLRGRIAYEPDSVIHHLRDEQGRRLSLGKAIRWVPWLMILAFGAAFATGAAILLRGRSLVRSGRASVADIVTVGFMLYTTLYAALVGTTLELGENMRFRFDTEPFMIVMLALFLAFVLRRDGGSVRRSPTG